MPQKKVTRDNVEQVFTYQPADQDQRMAYDAVREEMLNAAKAILDHCPDSPDRDQALRTLREARMWANASIALRGQV